MNIRLSVYLMAICAGFNICADNNPQKVKVTCTHNEEAIKQLIAYKHYKSLSENSSELKIVNCRDKLA